jgi:RNA recognition motif-containing protein
MAIKLFVGSLPYTTTDDELNELFASFGTIASARVIIDRESGRSKGFGFVEFEDDTAGKAAVTELDGADYQGRKLVVNEARPQGDRPPRREFGGGGDRGGSTGGPRRDFGGGNGGGRRY